VPAAVAIISIISVALALDPLSRLSSRHHCHHPSITHLSPNSSRTASAVALPRARALSSRTYGTCKQPSNWNRRRRRRAPPGICHAPMAGIGDLNGRPVLSGSRQWRVAVAVPLSSVVRPNPVLSIAGLRCTVPRWCHSTRAGQVWSGGRRSHNRSLLPERSRLSTFPSGARGVAAFLVTRPTVRCACPAAVCTLADPAIQKAPSICCPPSSAIRINHPLRQPRKHHRLAAGSARPIAVNRQPCRPHCRRTSTAVTGPRAPPRPRAAHRIRAHCRL